MLKKKYWTTPLYESSEREPLEIKDVAKPVYFRVFQILKLLIKTLWRIRFGFVNSRSKGIAWRSFFESMEGLWVKLGQLVAMRTDLFDPEFTNELKKLHSRVACFPFEKVKEIVEESLGKKLFLVFSEFDETAVAAASLAQVHKARLMSNGKLVAVKVQRPYAKEFLEKDLKIIRRLVNILKRFRAFESLMLDGMYWELEAMFTEEIDFRYEAANLKEAKKRFKRYNIYVPKVFKKLSSQKVIVMEFVKGVMMSDFIEAKEEDPALLKKWLKKNKIKSNKVGSFLMRNLWQQVLEDNFFHGDLQPGNIMLLAKSRVAFIDFGSIGSIDEEILSVYRQQLIAAGSKKYAKAADLYLLTSSNIPANRYVEVRKSVVRVIKSALLKGALVEEDVDKKRTVHNASNEANKELAKFRISPNWEFLKLTRTFMTIDPSIISLYPKINLQKEYKKYFTEARWRIMESRFTQAIDMSTKVTEAFGLYDSVLRRQGLDLRTTSRKGIMMTTFVLDFIKWVFIGGIFVLLSTLIFQHTNFFSEIQEDRGNWLTRLSSKIPYMSKMLWAAVLVIVYLFTRNYARLIQRLKEPERI